MQIMHFYLQAYKSIFGGRGIFDHAFLGQNESPPPSLEGPVFNGSLII